MNDTAQLHDQLHEWINHIFDHPVTTPGWYQAEDALQWPGAPEQIPTLMAETFERAGELLARFSDEQLDQGFWYLIGAFGDDFKDPLIDEGIPLNERLRALRSFMPLFEQVMAVRCSPHLSHFDSEGANPLNGACYMWWDLLFIRGEPLNPARAAFDAEVLITLRRQLAIPHDACRESALHGIWHWVREYPQFAMIIDEFLASASDMPAELITYAQDARAGQVR